MARASRRLWNPLHGWSGVWRYGDMAKRWQRAAAAGQRVRGDLGRQWQRVWCLVDRAGRGPSRPKPHTCGDPRRRPAWAKARQGSADISFCLWLTCYMVCCGITSKDQEQIINDPFTRYPRYPVPKSWLRGHRRATCNRPMQLARFTAQVLERFRS